MKTKSIILTIILGIFYPFAFIMRVKKNRITFISLEHDNLSKDFKLIYDRLKQKNKYELRTVQSPLPFPWQFQAESKRSCSLKVFQTDHKSAPKGAFRLPCSRQSCCIQIPWRLPSAVFQPFFHRMLWKTPEYADKRAAPKVPASISQAFMHQSVSEN